MNTLSPDTLYCIASELNKSDLINIVLINIKIRNMFLSKRFNSFWIEKLKQDYNVNYEGNNGYIEYLYYFRLHKVKYYSVVHSDNRMVYRIDIFKSKSEALINIYKKVVESIGENFTYLKFKQIMKSDGEITISEGFTDIKMTLLSSNIDMEFNTNNNVL